MAYLRSKGSASANTIRLQHERMNSLLEAIENRFQHERKPTRNLVSLVNALAVHLQTHFELEESDGYLSDLVQKSPGLAATVDRLMHEHSELMGDVNELVKRVREDFAINQDTSDLAHRFGTFRGKLAAHEHEENQLLQEAYNLDLGTKD
jgi:hypothetical protein